MGMRAAEGREALGEAEGADDQVARGVSEVGGLGVEGAAAPGRQGCVPSVWGG